ncbi:hypothetical protein Y032_1173g3728, partial [Ancylostoma ceylanicum]
IIPSFLHGFGCFGNQSSIEKLQILLQKVHDALKTFAGANTVTLGSFNDGTTPGRRIS